VSRKTLRLTRQRAIILEELKRTRTHPTADEVYATVRRRLPRISLGTVYRNLEVLSRLGLVRRLTLGGSPRRYDGTVEDHCHIRCVDCGRVEDVELAASQDEVGALVAYSPFEIIGHHIEFTGICPECAKQG